MCRYRLHFLFGRSPVHEQIRKEKRTNLKNIRNISRNDLPIQWLLNIKHIEIDSRNQMLKKQKTMFDEARNKNKNKDKSKGENSTTTKKRKERKNVRELIKTNRKRWNSILTISICLIRPKHRLWRVFLSSRDSECNFSALDTDFNVWTRISYIVCVRMSFCFWFFILTSSSTLAANPWSLYSLSLSLPHNGL